MSTVKGPLIRPILTVAHMKGPTVYGLDLGFSKQGHLRPAKSQTLRVQVPNNHTLTQNLYYNYYYPNPKYLIIRCMDPLGKWHVPSSLQL